MLYHVSPIHGIRTLTPRVSTHGRAYVYAVENPVTGLLFGTKHDDFDFSISTDEQGFPCITECYPNAMEIVFGGKSCSVYEIADDGFLRDMTGWDAELVCGHDVSVLSETVIHDLLQRLLDEERIGNLEVIRFSQEEEQFVISHVTDRLQRFGVDVKAFIANDQRYLRYTPAVRAAIDRYID